MIDQSNKTTGKSEGGMLNKTNIVFLSLSLSLSLSYNIP